MIVIDAVAMGSHVLQQLLAEAQARLEAEVLLADAVGQPRSWLFAHRDADLGEAEWERFLQRLSRRSEGEPLDYIIGRGEFYGLPLELTPDVLVPRPETEVLVEAALAAIAGRPTPLVADVGTGSGAIALAIAASHRGAHVIATDISLEALAVARRNALSLALTDRVYFAAADLLQPLVAGFDLIAANLPYVADGDLDGASAPVARYEPRLALAGGLDGLALIRRLLHQAATLLAPGGTLLAEIGSMHGAEASALASGCYPTGSIDVLADMSGSDRVLRVRMPL